MDANLTPEERPVTRQIDRALDYLAKELGALDEDLRKINERLLPPTPEGESAKEAKTEPQGWFEWKLDNLYLFQRKLSGIRQNAVRLKRAVDAGEVKGKS